ncbi:MAG: ABC transporter ATP-binding protein [Chloroflexota bacterium]
MGRGPWPRPVVNRYRGHVIQMQTGASILQTQDLTFEFGGNRILDGISLDVNEGEFLSIIGPNGAGKTTFFNVVSGLYRPSHGAIRYRGRDITTTNPSRRARLGMARSFQLTNLFPQLTTRENVRLAAQAQSTGRYQLLRPSSRYRLLIDRAESALDLAGLAAHHNVPAGSLSHGDKRKLELAIVIAMDPTILLLDEPTSGVSAEDVPSMVALIRHIREVEKKTVIMIEHKMAVILGLSDRIAVLHQGRLLAVDTPDRIQGNQMVQSAYLGRGDA